MKRVKTKGICASPSRTHNRHYPLKKGTRLLLSDGTKIIKEDGTASIVPVTYQIELGYDSPDTDEYIFWHRQRVKKINVLACQTIF